MENELQRDHLGGWDGLGEECLLQSFNSLDGMLQDIFGGRPPHTHTNGLDMVSEGKRIEGSSQTFCPSTWMDNAIY